MSARKRRANAPSRRAASGGYGPDVPTVEDAAKAKAARLRRERIGSHWVWTLLLSIVFTACTLMGADTLTSASNLRSHGVETVARVVETGKGGRRGHWVRYRFTVPGDPQTYVRKDAFWSRAGSSVTVSPDEWRRARESGTVRVRYLPFDPHVNLPTDAPPALENPWVGVACSTFTGLIALAGWASLFSDLRRHVRRRRSPPPPPPPPPPTSTPPTTSDVAGS